ncbi:MAG: cell division protein FtsZ [Pseudomonadota bacterium]
MSLKLELPKLTDLKPRITVMGVGGAGGNAINNMITLGLDGVEFVAANTDAQALNASSAEQRLQLGINLTEGLGAGSKPEIGEAAAEEAIDDIRAQLSGSHMLFVACGMGGGTGTGAASVIARTSRDMGILTVGVVTLPFQFEGTPRRRVADAGIVELRKYVDTLLVIPNQNLFRIANDRTTFAEAFQLADQVLYAGVSCITDLIVKEGLINLDFADVRTVMANMGAAMMGTGEASGERRAVVAAEEAIANPLLDDASLKNARGLLLSIIGGPDMTLFEVDEAATRVREEVESDANIIVGAAFDPSLGDTVRVAIVAAGVDPDARQALVPSATPAWPEHRLTAPAAAAAVAPPAEAPFSAAQDATPPVAAENAPSEAFEPARGPQAPLAPPHEAAPLAAAAAVAAPNAPAHEAWTAHGSTPAQPVATSPAQPQPAPVAPAAPPVAASPHDAHEAAAAPAWRAPNDVMIEERRPSTAGSTATPASSAPANLVHSPAPHATAPATPAMSAPAFEPAPPEEVRRAAAMPPIDAFPTVGQRAYRANAAATATATESQRGEKSTDQTQSAAPVAEAPAKRSSFFGRFTGKRAQASAGPQQEAMTGQSSPSSPQTANSLPSDENNRSSSGMEVSEEPLQAASERSAQDAELPVFFNSGRR